MKHSHFKNSIIAFALLLSTSAFAQFTTFSPNGGCSNGNVYSVYMTDANKGYFISDSCINKTSNGGQAFNNVGTGANTPSDFSWGDADTAYFANGDNIIYTYDGGSSWSKFQHGQGGLATDVHAFSGSHFIFVTTDGTLLETTDGGANYSSPSSGVSSSLNSLHFVSNSIGFACGDDGVIIKTTDGGQSWGKLNSGNAGVLKYIWFVDNNTGFACGDTGIIVKTTDGGSNWAAMNSGINIQLNCIKNAGNSLSTLYACGDQGVILKSTDGGTNWTNVKVTGVNDILEQLYFVDSTIGFCVGLNYTLLKIDPCPKTKFKIDQNTVCKGSQISITNLSSGSSNTYSWKVNGVEFATTANAQYTFTATGTYTISLYASSTVKSCDDSTSNTVTVLDVPAKTTISGLTTICQGGGTIILLSSTAAGYQWTNGSGVDIAGETNIDYVVSAAGTYRVKAVAANTCFTLSDPYTVTNVSGKPAPSFSSSVNGANISISNTTTSGDWYGWYISDVNTTSNYKLISNMASPATYIVNQGWGNYLIKLVTINGCGADSMTKTVTVFSGIGTIEQSQFEMYPNPAKNILNIKTQLSEKTMIIICDMAGKTFVSKTINPNTQETINIENLEKGIYMICFQTGNSRMVQKLVKE